MDPEDAHCFLLGMRHTPIFGDVLPSFQAYGSQEGSQGSFFTGCPILKWVCAHRGWRRQEVKEHGQMLLWHHCAHHAEGNGSSAPTYLLPSTCLPTHTSRHPHPYRNSKFTSGKNSAGPPGGARQGKERCLSYKTSL